MYTLENIIINPKDIEVEGLLGKFVFFGDSPQEVLHSANSGEKYARLSEIDEGGFFVGEDESGPYQCIIPKTDKKYRKFSGTAEFIDYASMTHGSSPDEIFLISIGIWVKDYNGFIYQVTGMDGTGVQFNGCFYYWDDLLSMFMFLDERRCGVYE